MAQARLCLKARPTASQLADRLRPHQGAYWSGIAVDLSHAVLSDVDMSGCRFDGGLRMEHAVFLGQARFRGAVVRVGASFNAAHFRDHAWFERTAFHGPAHLRGVAFGGDAWFGGTTFAVRCAVASRRRHRRGGRRRRGWPRIRDEPHPATCR